MRGLKALGVRELSYRLAFLACNVAPTNPRVSNHTTVRLQSPEMCPPSSNLHPSSSLVARRYERRNRPQRASRAR